MRGPERRLIEATPDGQAALASWLAEPVAHVRDVRSELLVKLLLLDRAGKDPLGLLEAQATRIRPMLVSLRKKLARSEGFDATLARWRLTSAEALARFLAALIEARQPDAGSGAAASAGPTRMRAEACDAPIRRTDFFRRSAPAMVTSHKLISGKGLSVPHLSTCPASRRRDLLSRSGVRGGRKGIWRAAVVAAAGTVLGLVTVIPGTGSAVASTAKGGPVDVLYAGSLVDTMGKIGPAFEKATGYTFEGFSAGSSALATEIQGKTQEADVFVSAAGSAVARGGKNGDWVSWYAQFGTTPLLIGYNPKSKFAKDFKTEPWYKVIAMPGLRLGRTDPVARPEGRSGCDRPQRRGQDVRRARARRPSRRRLPMSFPRRPSSVSLQAGQLDAGFFYGVEAEAASIPTVTLGVIKLTNPYTVTVVNRAPHQAGAVAFVAFLLSSKGAAILQSEGLTLDSPAILSGPKSAGPRVAAAVS